LRAPTMRPSPSRARVGTSAGIYSQRTRLVQYIYIHRCQVRVCNEWVRVCILAYACDRVRVLTMREYAACARVRRALFVRPSMEHARTQCMYAQCMHVAVSMRVWLHRRADRRCGPPHERAHVLRPCARACACAIGGPRIRADTCERLPVGGGPRAASARRRSTMRRRSTRTSARGTPPRSPRCIRYAPPLSAPGRATLGGVVDAARAVVRGGAADALARLCAQTYAHAHARVSTCVGIAARTKDGIYVCMYVCIYIYM
jgi:hypothetical protein